MAPSYAQIRKPGRLGLSAFRVRVACAVGRTRDAKRFPPARERRVVLSPIRKDRTAAGPVPLLCTEVSIMYANPSLTDFFAHRQARSEDRHLGSVDFSLIHHITSQRAFRDFDDLVRFCRDQDNLSGFLPDPRDQVIFSSRLVEALGEYRRWSASGDQGPSTEPR